MALATSFMVFLFCSAIVYASLRCQWRSINNSNKSQTLDRVVLYSIEYKHDPAINWKWIVKPHTHRSNETKHFFFLFQRALYTNKNKTKSDRVPIFFFLFLLHLICITNSLFTLPSFNALLLFFFQQIKKSYGSQV